MQSDNGEQAITIRASRSCIEAECPERQRAGNRIFGVALMPAIVTMVLMRQLAWMAMR